MRLQSVKDLKNELRGVGQPLGVGGFIKVAGTSLPVARSFGIALGIAPGSGVQDFRLAVRTTRLDPNVSQYVHTLRMATSGDMDFQHVGDILATPPVPATAQPLRQRHRPLAPGYSVGHVSTTAGTIGGFVEVGGVPHILSNNHVLALSNAATHGDPIVQPGPFDGGQNPRDLVSRLGGFVPLQPVTNLVDVALGVLPLNADPDTLYFGNQIGAVVHAQLGLQARKVGRTTGVTQGIVTAVAVDDIEVRYGNTVLSFDDQIEIEGDTGHFSDGGDSGSLILDLGNNPFGLLFAGSSERGKTFANPISTVLQLCGANLLR